MFKKIFCNDVKKQKFEIIGGNLLFGFVVINILTGMCAGIISMVLPLFVVSIGATASEVGIIRGISGIGALVMVLPSGLLVDNFGSKKLYIVGSIFSTLTTVVLAFSSSPLIIIISMALQGFSNSLRFTSLNAAFFSKLNEIGIKKSGWYRGAMSIGLTFVGPLLGGYFISTFSYFAIFNITAMLTLLPIVPLLLLILMEDRKRKNIIVKFKILEQLKEFKELLKDNVLRQTVIIEGISTACFSSFLTFIVVYMVNILKVDVKYASWFLIAEGVAYILVVFLGGGLLYRYSRKTLYIISLLAMALGLLGIGTSQNIWVIFLGIIILGAGTGLLNIVTYSSLGNVKGKKGKVSSALSACTGIGTTFGPMFGGFIGDALSYKFIFLTYIPILLLVLSYLFLTKSRAVEMKAVKNIS
ncbi:MFS transporter [Clostridium cellulovorans]|uniref:Major facilitator superfamily MFS_1 n=1 Tax=Clostridium cellulovorans (strain ATCC 35296 / DSM 3052 / OCM 3 / 743B) TaxID=573061 RepID=D9SVW6_CLOC7|nr:MFS transporter [Clostridium cellulovorans]ADL53177.1 major facilitator superfamily MFS_1 [Clostridium cellulovorans 743B]